MPHIGAANRRGIVGPWGKSRQEDKAMAIATASDFEIAPARPLLRPLAAAAACVALADWLFYGWQIGISVAVFFSVLGIVAVASNGVHTTRNIQIVMSAAFIAGLLALIEDVNTWSMIVGALATAMFVIVITAEETSPWQRYLFEAATTPFRGPFRLGGDVFGALRHMKIWTPGWLGSLIAWIVPLSVFAVFLALFSSANPLIENRLMQVDLRAFFNLLDANRIWFWILVACTIWPLLRRRIRREPTPELEPRPTNAVESSDLDYLLGIQAVTRSLVLFNVLFALQTGLDLVYLWGGVALPDGLTYAEYAHRGAYPLIATALLAAGLARGEVRADPAAGSGLDRPKRPSRHLVDPATRSLCRRLLADLSAARRIDLDGTGGRGATVDADPDHVEKTQFLAGRRQRRYAGPRPLRMLPHQRAAGHRLLQRGALPRSRRAGAQSRSKVSFLAWTPSLAYPRTPFATHSDAQARR
jgi:hypothetical protein